MLAQRGRIGRRALVALVGLSLLALPPRLEAKPCGDAVRGRDVPCACGDVVVSDLTLGAGDPVVAGPCDGDGLIVRADGGAAVTVDLAGHTLAGRGHGAGLRVVYGGPGGARIVSGGTPATIAGFADGIVAYGPDALGLLDGVVVERSVRDGVWVRGVGYEIRRTEVRSAGRDGFVLAGDGFRLSATRAASSGRDGYVLRGRDAVVGGADGGPVVAGAGRHGIAVSGAGQRVVGCTVDDARGDGLQVAGDRIEIADCVVRRSGGGGIVGHGADLRLHGNRVLDGAGRGIRVSGLRVADGGGNAAGGRPAARKGEGPAAEECTIGGAPCRP
jgi:hypothetical protein